MGFATLFLLVLQSLMGMLIAYDPGMRLLGGEVSAKTFWKYHRRSRTFFSEAVSHIELNGPFPRRAWLPHPSHNYRHHRHGCYQNEVCNEPFKYIRTGLDDSWAGIHSSRTLEWAEVWQTHGPIPVC